MRSGAIGFRFEIQSTSGKWKYGSASGVKVGKGQSHNQTGRLASVHFHIVRMPTLQSIQLVGAVGLLHHFGLCHGRWPPSGAQYKTILIVKLSTTPTPPTTTNSGPSHSLTPELHTACCGLRIPAYHTIPYSTLGPAKAPHFWAWLSSNTPVLGIRNHFC